jgi:phage gp29-like protein
MPRRNSKKSYKEKPVQEATRSPRRRRQRDWPSRREVASRQNSLEWGGLIGYLPNPDPVLINIGRDMTVYQDIRHDPHLTAVISSRKAGVKSMLWEIDRGKSKSRQAKAVTLAFKKLDIYRIVNDILDYFLTGLAPTEVMWDKPNEAGLIMPFEVMGKPPEWFMFDGQNVLKFRSQSHPSDGEEIPPRKILLPRHNPTYKNPYGESLLSTVYWPIIFKFGGMKFWVKFAEKYGMPFAVGKAPRSAGQTEFENLADMLLDLVQDSVAAIPDDSKVEFLQAGSKTNSADMYRDLLSFCNMEISKAILGHGAAADSTPGKLGNENSQLNVREDIVNEDKRIVEGCMNELIKWIMEINFGLNLEMPQFTLFQEQDIEKDRAERDKTLADTGQIQFTQQYIDSGYGFKKGDVIVKPAATEEIVTEVVGEKAKAAFAEATKIPKDQAAVDDLIQSYGPADLRKQADFVKPIFKIFQKSNNYSEAMEELINNFEDVHPTELSKMLTQAVFVTELWGRLQSEAP